MLAFANHTSPAAGGIARIEDRGHLFWKPLMKKMTLEFQQS
jgi:hypothetical protein